MVQIQETCDGPRMQSSDATNGQRNRTYLGLNQDPLPLVTAELVNQDEEQPRMEQEVESRLMQRGGHRLVVAEVVNPANNPINGPSTSDSTVSCEQRFWKWKFLLLFILLCACGALVGVIISGQSSATTSFSTGIPTPSPAIVASPTASLTTTPIATSSPTSGQSPSQFIQSPTLSPTFVQSPTQSPTTHDQARQSRIKEILRQNSIAVDAIMDIPQWQALNWLLFNDTNSVLRMENFTSDSFVLQRYALAVLYYSTNGNGWINQRQFLRWYDVCNWNDGSSSISDTFGVYCADQSHVTGIWLSQNNLSGTIPSELRLLSNLNVLGLASNRLETIPAELGDLTLLQELLIQNSSLSGTVPVELGRLVAMTNLLVHSNNLVGTLPSDLGYLTNLLYLDTYFNQFTGTLPTEFGQLTALTRFHLYNNAMTGTLPTEFGKMSALETLRVQFNNFNGTLPNELGGLQFLTHLYTFNNSFTAPYPTELYSILDFRP